MSRSTFGQHPGVSRRTGPSALGLAVAVAVALTASACGASVERVPGDPRAATSC